MAEVSMDLAELDKMRNKIKSLEIDKETLKDQKQQILDDQHQVIIHHKAYRGVVKSGPKANSRDFVLSGVRHQTTVHTPIGSYSTYGMGNHDFDLRHSVPTAEHINEEISFDTLLDQGYLRIDMEEVHGETSRDYKNMSEVVETIREEEQLKVAEQTKVLTKRAQDNAEKFAVNEGVYEDNVNELKVQKERAIKDILRQMEDLNEKFTEEIIQIKAEHSVEITNAGEKYRQLAEEFQDFKENKKRVSLEEELLELKAELFKTKEKLPFWKK